MNDAKNSSENALYYTGLATGLDKSNFETEDEKVKSLSSIYDQASRVIW